MRKKDSFSVRTKLWIYKRKKTNNKKQKFFQIQSNLNNDQKRKFRFLRIEKIFQQSVKQREFWHVDQRTNLSSRRVQSKRYALNQQNKYKINQIQKKQSFSHSISYFQVHHIFFIIFTLTSNFSNFSQSISFNTKPVNAESKAEQSKFRLEIQYMSFCMR